MCFSCKITQYTDVDECLSRTHNCSRDCVDAEGSYWCNQTNICMLSECFYSLTNTFCHDYCSTAVEDGTSENQTISIIDLSTLSSRPCTTLDESEATFPNTLLTSTTLGMIVSIRADIARCSPFSSLLHISTHYLEI